MKRSSCAHEAAAVGQVDERILVRELVELLDACLQLRDLVAQLVDLVDQAVRVWTVGQLVRHRPPSQISSADWS